MADEFGCNGANIILDPSVESFHHVVRENIDRLAQAAIAALDAAYQTSSQTNPQAHGVQVIFNISHSFRSLGTQAELDDQVAERDRVGVAEDLAQLNMDIVDRILESDPHETENHTAEETHWMLIPSIVASLFSTTARLLDSLPVVSFADLKEDSKDCPICHLPFSDSDLNEVDTPILLRCNHVIGRKCVERWVLEGHNSCPFCRSAIFEPVVLPTLADE